MDEYDTPFRFKPRRSTQPLSMGELIGLIDGTTGHLDGDREGLTSAYRDYNLDGCDAERLVEFVTVTSDFYPVQAYYEEEAVSGSPRSKLGRPSDRLLTPCTRLVERWSSVRWATCGCRLEAPPRQRRLRGRNLSRPSPRASGFAEEAGERLLSIELSERPDLPNALRCRR